MAFLPSAQVTGVISDRRTIGSGEPHRIAILSPPACLHIDLLLENRSVHALPSSQVMHPGSSAAATLAGIKYPLVIHYNCSLPEAESYHEIVWMSLQNTCAHAWLTNSHYKRLEVTANILLAELWSANVSVKKVQNVSENICTLIFISDLTDVIICKCQTVFLLVQTETVERN